MHEQISVFVINLERDSTRLALISSDLDELGIRFRVEVGVDTTEGTASIFEDLIEARLASPEAIRRLAKGSIGCALSHQAVYRRMIKEGIQAAVILEDDAVLSPGAASAIHDIPLVLRRDEILLLFSTFAADGPFEISAQGTTHMSGGSMLHWPLSKHINSAVAYAISNEVAHGLVEANTPIDFPSDDWCQYFERGAIDRIRIVQPNCVSLRDIPSTRTALAAAKARDGVSGSGRRQSFALLVRTLVARTWIVRRAQQRRVTNILKRRRNPTVVELRSEFDPEQG